MDDIVQELHNYADHLEAAGGTYRLAAVVNRNAAGTIKALRQRQRELLDRVHRLNEELLNAQFLVQHLNDVLADFEERSDDCA
jgi:hypothetical protein